MNYSLYVMGCVFVLAISFGIEANAQTEPTKKEVTEASSADQTTEAEISDTSSDDLVKTEVAPLEGAKKSELTKAPLEDKKEKPLTAEEQEALNLALEQDTVEETTGSVSQVLAPVSLLDLSFLLDFGGAYFTKHDNDEAAAAADPGHDIGSTGFSLQQVEMTLGANVDPFFRFDSTIVFTLEGVEVEEAFGTAQALPGNLQVRFGQFISAFGRQNTQHLHQWSFINQPLILRKFFGVDGSRGLGTEISWLSFLPWYAELSLAVNVGEGRSFVEEVNVKDATDLVYTAKLDQLFPLTENLSIDLGLSGKAGPNEIVEGIGTLVGAADLYVRYRPVDSETRTAVSWTTEFMLRSRDVGQGLGDGKLDFGGYTQLVWSIDRRWEVGTRFEHVSGFANDPLDLDWSDARQRGALQTTFYPSHFSKIRLQTSLENIPNEDLNFGALISIELNAGSHGAHKF